MKVIIAGSRDFNDYDLLKSTMDELVKLYPDVEVVSGGARGADKLGEKWANEHRLKVHQFIPDWSIGKSAGYKRNEDMAKFADAAVCFYNGKSPGTKHMIDLSKKYKLKLKIIYFESVS